MELRCSDSPAEGRAAPLRPSNFRMRVTFVLPNDGMTGGVRVVATYAERLARRGHEITVVAAKKPMPSLFNKLRSLISGKGWPQFKPGTSYFDSSCIHVKRLGLPRPVIEDDVPDADIVVATWWETAEWVAKFSQRKGTKVYLVQHHEVFPHLPIERARATYKLPFKKIVISRWLERIMREQYGDETAELVPNSVDERQFFAPKRVKRPVPSVGFVYSRAEFKGSDIVLEALKKVKQELPSLEVIAFGAEHPTKTLPAWISFHYQPPQEKIRTLYSLCDVWLCGSRSEGFYLPMLEAMACRCPVVSTRVGGPIDNIVDGINGFLVNVEDAGALAKQTLAVLRLPESEWQNMSEAALMTATRYSWEDATDKLEQAFLRWKCE